MRRRARCAAALLAGFALLSAATSAHAKILKTRRAGQYHELDLVVGSGFEYETDGEESEYGFPGLVEYGITKILKVSVEPGYVLVRKKAGGSLSGPGDLETTITCELPTERRWRPGLAFAGLVKWPTAPRGDLGTGERDVALGVLLGKEFVGFDLDLEASHTWIGDPPGVDLRNTLELSLACEWHLSPSLDLEAEVVSASAAGGRFRSGPGALASFANLGGPEQGQSEYETTLGLAEFLTKCLKLEEGVVSKWDGSWQFVLGWEYDFGEGR
jgi:hypothetical protein